MANTIPVDAVFTWVDGNDPEWLLARQERAIALKKCPEKSPTHESFNVARFRDNEELRYALRSFAQYAPFIRKVHLVTEGHIPKWINSDTVNIVRHADIFPDKSVLPVFSTRPIELCVHRIQGLAEHFIYANDDFMLGRTLTRKDFFTDDGTPVIWATKLSSKRCRSNMKKYTSTHGNAVRNSCGLIQNKYGKTFPYRMRHYPKAMTVSTVNAMWEVFLDEIHHTLHSPFRSDTDISITMLYPLYLLATGQGKLRVINGYRQVLDAFTGGVYHMGTSVGDKNMERKIQQIKLLKPKTFCINDSGAASNGAITQLRATLKHFFPAPSQFEKEERTTVAP